MPLDTTVKTIYEERVYLSSSSQTLLSIGGDGAAIETGSAAAMAWQEISFLRAPFTDTSPTQLFDVYKRYLIDHTKRGRQQTKTLAFTGAFQNTGVDLRRFDGLNLLLKVEWHVEDAAVVDEYEYYSGVRFQGYTKESPDGEVTERIEARYAQRGKRTGP